MTGQRGEWMVGLDRLDRYGKELEMILDPFFSHCRRRCRRRSLFL